MFHKRTLVALTAMALLVVVSGCGRAEPEPVLKQGVPSMRIQVTSAAFTEGARIPVQYTCDGEDKSPGLKWSGLPDGGRSIALIADDPDAPGATWVHWVLYGLSADTTELNEGVPATETLSSGSRQGTNDFKKIGYGGSCPPPGHGVHRYYFKVYALDSELGLPPGVTKSDLLRAMDGHIVAQGQLMGTYERK